MAVVSPDFVISKINQGYTFWQITEHDGRTVISEQNENKSKEESADLFQEALANIEGGIMVKMQQSTFTPGKGGLKRTGEVLNIRTNGTKKGISGAEGTGGNMAMMLGLMDRLNKLELEKQKIELERQENSPALLIANKIVENEAIMSGLAGILTRLFLPAPPIAAPAPKPVKNNEDAQEVLSAQTLQDISEIFEEPDQSLGKLIAVLKNDPSALQTIKQAYNLK